MYRLGFTLIELLVVIVVVGILVALALPNFIKIKDKAREAEVKHNLHSIQIALERYAVDDDEGVYPYILMGGDWTDSFVVWQSWVDMQQGLSLDLITNFERRDRWEPAGIDVGDPLVMDGVLNSYPANPFARSKSDTLLRRIHHFPVPVVSSPYWRYVGGNDGDKMSEVFGPIWVGMLESHSIAGDFYVHHIYNNPPYDQEHDIYKEPAQGWTRPSGNSVLVGNFSYWPRGEDKRLWSANFTSAAIGYTLAGYGALHSRGQDVYNRNGNYQGRFRTEDCDTDCQADLYGDRWGHTWGYGVADIPCICANDGAMPSPVANNGGSDTIPDGVILTLDSGADRKSSKPGGDVAESENSEVR